MNDTLSILRLYLASSLILLFCLPLGWVILGQSRRHLVLYSRILGLLLVNFTVGLLAGIGILGFTVRGILLALILLAAVGVLLGRHQRVSRSDIQSWWRRCWKSLVFDEAVFLLALVLFAVLISFQPKIFGTEKNMDFMFLNALMRGTGIPPHDAWFAGETINYYYGGYMTVALLGRLSALPPAYTYNLALAFLFAATVALAWAFGRQLSGSRRLAALAPLTLAVMGNAEGLLQVLRVGWPYRIDYFSSSRVIVDGSNGNTINEFPFFSFIHADLHPHVMAIPFVLLFLILLYEFLLNFRAGALRDAPAALLGRFLVLCMALGALDSSTDSIYPASACCLVECWSSERRAPGSGKKKPPGASCSAC